MSLNCASMPVFEVTGAFIRVLFSKGSFKGYYKGTYRGLKDPIIRHLVLGKQLCRLGFWRVYDY